MCGIAGVRRYGDVPINAEECKILLQSLERRGPHATGMAAMVNGEIKICKMAKPAWAFCESKEAEDFMAAFLEDASIVLLHTRAATIGDPGENENNHPFFAGNCAIVHNGGIHNHQLLFDQLKAERHAETDSDVIRAILDQKGITEDGIKELNRMTGSAAVAAISQANPEVLLLARSGSPLHYGTNATKLWWASEQQAIQKAVRPWEQHHGLWTRRTRNDVGYFNCPDHTAYILSPTGIEMRREFKVCSHYTPPAYNFGPQNYGAKMQQMRADTRRKKRENDAKPPIVVVGQRRGVGVVDPGFKHAKCPDCGINLRHRESENWRGYFCSNEKCNAPLGRLDS